MAIKIGITGGIGSGKSKVMSYLENLGYAVYYSDKAGKKVMQKQEIIQQVQAIFSDNVIVNNELDRKKIAEIVFNDKEKLNLLNAIVHPAVAKDFEEFVQENKDKNIIFYESAILIETSNHLKFDKVVLITAPLNIRIQRVMHRDNISEEVVKERMNNQLADNEKAKYADFIIENVDFKKTKEKINKMLDVVKNK